MKRTGLFLLLALCSGVSTAQVVNGNFANGPSAWSWKKAVFASDASAHCGNATYTGFTAGSNSTPWVGFAPAEGRVALATDYFPYAAGSWTTCRRVEQSVYIPHASQLSFVAKLGDEVPPYATGFINPVTLSVLVVSEGRENSIFSVEGASHKCNINVGCPAYRTYTVDLSQYWGKSVTLVFRGATAGVNNGWGTVSQPSAAYVDNVIIR